MPTFEQRADLVAGTLKELGEYKWSELAFPLVRYPGFQQLLKKQRLKISSGYAFQFNAQTSTNGNAQHVGLNAVDNVTITDSMITGNGVLKNTTNSWGIDEREITANMGKRQIFDLVKTNRASCWGDMVKKVEATIWGLPNASATNDPLTSLFYPITSDTASSTGAFTTGSPSGFTTILGIDPTTVARWRNWAFIYTNVTKTDMARSARSAAFNTGFESPVDVPEYGSVPDYGVYAPYSVVSRIEELLEQQNQNLGTDFASMDGRAMFQRNPITSVPYLTNRGGAPIIGVNWSQLKFRYLDGEYFREMQKPAPMQHRTVQHFVDLTWGLECYDRSSMWIGTTSGGLS